MTTSPPTPRTSHISVDKRILHILTGVLAFLLAATILTGCGKKGQKEYEKGLNLYTLHHPAAAQQFAIAANLGHAGAQCKLGDCFAEGLGVRRDLIEAVKWYRMAADQGDAEAQYNLSNCLMSGQGVKEDQIEAAKMARKAAEQGFAAAQDALGVCYGAGLGVNEDLTESVKWFRKAAEQGHSWAQLHLGDCYYSGLGIKEDKAEAVKWTRKAADQGLVNAQLMLGCYIGTGQGIKEDLTEAAKWFRAAAEQGNSKAQVILSQFYFYGIGVKKDYQEAREWNNTAARELGGKILFYRVEEPYKSYYFHWIKRAAEQGDAEAQSELGSLYQTGFCCKDMTEAMKWFRKAAEQGNQSGINQLKIFERDCENAERGDAEAQYQLGRIYAQGDSEGKYLSEAMKWLRKAAEQGHENAISLLKELEKKNQ